LKTKKKVGPLQRLFARPSEFSFLLEWMDGGNWSGLAALNNAYTFTAGKIGSEIGLGVLIVL